MIGHKSITCSMHVSDIGYLISKSNIHPQRNCGNKNRWWKKQNKHRHKHNTLIGTWDHRIMEHGWNDIAHLYLSIGVHTVVRPSVRTFIRWTLYPMCADADIEFEKLSFCPWAYFSSEWKTENRKQKQKNNKLHVQQQRFFHCKLKEKKWSSIEYRVENWENRLLTSDKNWNGKLY